MSHTKRKCKGTYKNKDRIGKVLFLLGLAISGKQGRCLALCGSRAELHSSGGALGKVDGAWAGLVCAEGAGASQQGNRRF